MEYKKEIKRLFDRTVHYVKRSVSSVVLKLPELEIKVLDATSNESWGPHGGLMAEIAKASRNHDDYVKIMGCLWRRLASKPKHWRQVYKALTLLEHLLINGNERIVNDIPHHIHKLQTLSRDFVYIEPPPSEKDQGINVRRRAEAVLNLLSDKHKFMEIRRKALANRNKYYGIESSSFAISSKERNRHQHRINRSSSMRESKRESAPPPSYEETCKTFRSSSYTDQQMAYDATMCRIRNSTNRSDTASQKTDYEDLEKNFQNELLEQNSPNLGNECDNEQDISKLDDDEDDFNPRSYKDNSDCLGNDDDDDDDFDPRK